MRSIGSSFFPIRGKILAAPSTKRLPGLSCLELRKEIQESARRHLKMREIWEHFIYEVYLRIKGQAGSLPGGKADRFTPTDVSLIFLSFASIRKSVPIFLNFLLESVRGEINRYEIRDIAVLYNSIAKLQMDCTHILNDFVGVIEEKLTRKTSEKDIALLLNALLKLGIKDVGKIFVKSSLILSSRIRFINNCHTLTLLLHSYSRFRDYAPYIGQDSAENIKDVEPPELTSLSSVSISILGKCLELLMQMRPTDLLYLYMSSVNLLYNNSSGITQQVYSRMLNIYKLHNRLKERLLEFEPRELLLLSETCVSVLESAKQFKLRYESDSPTEAIDNEVIKTIPLLKDAIFDELAYRSRNLSFADSLGFLKMLEIEDNRVELIYKRLCQKLEKQSSWERYTNSELFEIVHKILGRSEVYTSRDSQLLLLAIIKNLSCVLKMSELCLLCEASARLGVKCNALSRKVQTIICRADSVKEVQIGSLIYSLSGLGYLEVVDALLPFGARVHGFTNSLNVLTALAILKINGLKSVTSELLKHLSHEIQKEISCMILTELDKRKIAFIQESGIIEENLIESESEFKIGSSFFPPKKYIIIESIKLKSKNSKIDIGCKVLTREESVYNLAKHMTEFVEEFDPTSKVYYNFKINNIILPILVEFSDGEMVAIQPLLNDFYSGQRQMLRIDAFAQLKLIDALKIPRVCCDILKYLKSQDMAQFMADLLKECYSAKPKNKIAEDLHKSQKVNGTPPIELTIRNESQTVRLDSFSRLRRMVTTTNAQVYARASV